MKRLGALLLVAACATGRDKGGLVAHPEVNAPDLTARSGRRLALLIGVNETKDELWPSLRYAASDALDLARVLADPEGGRFETEVTTSGSTTTRAGLLAALDRLAERNTSPNDTVVVYFSGHGTLAPTADGTFERVLVASDTRHAALRESGLTSGELERRFESLRSRRKVLIIAACHTGSGKSVLPPEVEKSLQGVKGPRPLNEVSRAVMMFSAAAYGEAAREDDRLGHDIYTSFFLEALRQKQDRNHDGAVSAEEAHDYARARTYYFTEGKQTPTAQITVVGVDPVVLAGEVSTKGMPELGSFDERWAGSQVHVDGRLKGELPGMVALEPGEHQVSVMRGGATLASGELSLSAGDRVDVDALVLKDTGVTLGLRAGPSLFLTPTLNATIGGPVPLVVVGLGKEVGHFRFLGELGAGGLRSSIAPEGVRVPVDLALAQGALGVQYVFDFRVMKLFTGPQLNLSFMWRSVPGRADLPTQRALLTAPAWAVEGRYPLTRSLELSLAGQVSYSLLALDGVVTHVGAASLGLGLAWRFFE
ncbi:MAG: caspase family protein [Myxococcaceae bacterium]|nr:caspase family protein [Myxococcaceae bacterium]